MTKQITNKIMKSFRNIAILWVAFNRLLLHKKQFNLTNKRKDYSSKGSKRNQTQCFNYEIRQRIKRFQNFEIIEKFLSEGKNCQLSLSKFRSLMQNYIFICDSCYDYCQFYGVFCYYFAKRRYPFCHTFRSLSPCDFFAFHIIHIFSTVCYP
jgi:epoxyqueuosine reductase QueG